MRFLPALALVLTLAPTPAAAADGDLDVDGFQPPHGMTALAWGNLQSGGGLIGPDGAAVSLATHNGLDLFWRRTEAIGPGDPTCPFTPPLASGARLRAAAFDGEGRLLITGSATFPGLGSLAFVARYLYPDCTLDASFSDDGYFTLDLDDDVAGLRIRTQVFFVLGVRVERILVAGNRYPSGGGGGADLFVFRLREEGTLDPTFNGVGWASFDFEGEADLLADFVIDEENRIVLGGTIDLLGTDPDVLVARLLPDGTLDGGFGTAGWRRFDFALDGEDLLGSLTRAANGDLYFAGTTRLASGTYLGVSRLNATLLQGAHFALGDVQAAVLGGVLQGDRKLVLAGWSDGLDGDFDAFAIRFLVPPTGTPQIDPSFGHGAEPDPLTYFSFDNSPGATDAAWGVDLMHGRPVLFGEIGLGDPQGIFVAGLENGYVFADGFESGDRSAW